MRQGRSDVGDDRRHLVKSYCPADVRGAGYEDLSRDDLIYQVYIINYTDGSCNGSGCACKALDVRREGFVIRPVTDKYIVSA